MIVALVGHRRSGKDTVANYLVNHYTYENMKLSYYLKECTKIMFDLTDEDLETDKKDNVHPKWNIKPRQIMQFLGTEVMQFQLDKLIPDLHRCFWVKRLCDDIDKHPNKSIVISDVRFQHEISYLKEKYPTRLCIVKLVRAINTEEDVDQHISEQEHAHIKADHLIVNNGTVHQLYNNVDIILNQS